MKMSDKVLLHLLEKSGPKSSTEIYHLLKKKFPYIDRAKILSRLKRLSKKSSIRLTKAGKFVSQTPAKAKGEKDPPPQGDFLEICKKYEFKPSFTKQQLDEADRLKGWNIKETSRRKNYRNTLVITIDGSDAKDLDDGVSVVKKIDGYLLTVHIADVSYYVKENSAIDLEARERGNSVYLIDKVIPMIPEALSNGICSLNAGVGRLSVSAEIKFNRKGEVVKYAFFEGIIQVGRRFTYEEVQAVLDKGSAVTQDQKPYVKMIKNMKQLADILYKKRTQNGSIDFNFDELKILVDENSHPVEILKKKRLTSHQIIEDFMLSANRVVAKYLNEKGKAVFRVHDTPDSEKVSVFNQFVQKFGYHLNNPLEPDPKEFQRILSLVSGKQEEKLISVIMLRTMKQAIYSTENKGHFALAFEDYTHFTSPIRRYSDLLVHRLLKKAMGVQTEDRLINGEQFLIKVTQHISTTERTAMEAERDLIKKKGARFMKDKVGQVFAGSVSGVTSFGLFIETDLYGVEGLVRMSDLKGFYHFDEENYMLVREDRKSKYQLGTRVKAKLAKVDISRNFIDMVLVES